MGNGRSRKLFLSFTELLRQMRDEKITPSDLDTGLYFFFCAPGHVFDTGKGGWDNEAELIFKDCPKRGRQTLKKIRTALAKAMEENRSRSWLNDIKRFAQAYKGGKFPEYLYVLLNELLEANGYPPLPISSLDGEEYNRARIKQIIKRLKIGLDAIGPR
ncbi:MAG: hypothetical protein A2745_02140 [Candidatus Harrisonbacteria bacterium RIFCSPHIGHO2_01_FULL_44_13]|uniref:Uncharacterized protein n=1 Tax=Candidatus Harrisonbacteria bacterium RIFCSPLOWO2_01_FULL_44_18 TaxID=1798407 RepID=A0A1G1ZNL7_9BACT|nr:MAG: hypothetical protein A2745_02140 [Candidatus Harrisonbacteria bacterium RIFCSPHIGHO2_01_FULL_44_13]OGY66019.1 MAG: hypothetical protein A3A16_01385 [Candidatus Harrisonbacteria bacterium RIFCSPLOWO2_01_FULL_44_18]